MKMLAKDIHYRLHVATLLRQVEPEGLVVIVKTLMALSRDGWTYTPSMLLELAETIEKWARKST